MKEKTNPNNIKNKHATTKQKQHRTHKDHKQHTKTKHNGGCQLENTQNETFVFCLHNKKHKK